MVEYRKTLPYRSKFPKGIVLSLCRSAWNYRREATSCSPIKYKNFVVAGADNKYRWNMDSYSGTLSNGINGVVNPADRPTGMQFSTPDEDNDNAPGGSCAAMRSTGWWLNACTSANLNEVAPMWPSTTAAP